MSTLDWIVLAIVLPGIYLISVIKDRYASKKWNFKITLFGFVFSFIIAMLLVVFSSSVANEYVKKNIPHEWKEEVLLTQEVADISRNCEQEGFFFLGIGGINERETFRFTIVGEDGTRMREKLYTSDCHILKADKKQEIARVKNIRVYKNPADEKFFRNFGDKTKNFYKVYIL